jgi:hypothetical protein
MATGEDQATPTRRKPWSAQSQLAGALASRVGGALLGAGLGISVAIFVNEITRHGHPEPGEVLKARSLPFVIAFLAAEILRQALLGIKDWRQIKSEARFRTREDLLEYANARWWPALTDEIAKRFEQSGDIDEFLTNMNKATEALKKRR